MRRLPERDAWLVLSAAAGVGPRSCGALLRRFGSAARVVAATGPELAACPGFGVARGGALARDLASIDPRELDRAAARAGQQIFTPADAGYPRIVRESADPPAALFVRGTLPPLAAAGDPGPTGVALVGTRAASPYGTRIARLFAEGLCRAGVVVVSGLARGVDGAAHAQALAVGGLTVAVLGCGVDVVYPPEHHALHAEIAAKGALVSEHPPGTPPHPGHFPRRNRIVAALSRAVVVVEAPLSSGALSTARLAAELGRDVMAVPGPVDRGHHAGAHRLLRDGALLVETPADVLGALGLPDATAAGAGAVAPRPAVDPPLAGPAHGVFGALDLDEARDADAVCLRTGLSPDVVCDALTILELDGLVVRMPGAGYLRVR